MEINRGGQFSQDKRSRAKEKGALILPLLLCGKNISAHAQSLGVTDVESEIDLILARASWSMFTAPDDISRMTTCPAHRSSLGIGWRRGSQRCRVPEILSSHAHGKSRKAHREIKDHSYACGHIYSCK